MNELEKIVERTVKLGFSQQEVRGVCGQYESDLHAYLNRHVLGGVPNARELEAARLYAGSMARRNIATTIDKWQRKDEGQADGYR